MRPNRVKQLWREGKPAVGCWLNLGNPFAAEIMAHVGFDWLLVDMEHGAIDITLAQTMFQAISTTNTIPFVRVPWNDAASIKQALDAGAYGVVVPMVNTAEEAKRAVAACRYPPQGERSVGPTRAQLYAGPDYLEHANEEIAVVVQIEHPDAVARIEEILQVPDLDAIFVGPSDLAATMGIPVVPDNTHPRHVELVAKVLTAAKRQRVPAGIMTYSAEAAKQKLAEGFLFVSITSDARLLAAAARNALIAATG